VADPYRGDDAATDARLKQLDAEVAGREAELTDVFWEKVAPVWGVPRTLSVGTGDPRAPRHARIALLDGAIARARSGPWAERDLPPVDEPAGGLLGIVAGAISVRPPHAAHALAAARTHHADAELAYRGGQVWGVRVRVGEAPIDIAVERYIRHTSDPGRLRQTVDRATLMTTVVPSAELTLKVERNPEDDDATARAFLDSDARHTLLGADVFEAPTLACRGGMLTITTSAVTKPALERLSVLLARWHAMPSPMPLLSDDRA